MKEARIILADDHVLIRRGLKKIIDGEDNLRVVGEAADGLELIGLLENTSADLVLLDISMPHMRGIEAIKEVRAVRPKIKVLILTMHSSKEFLCSAMQAGANGYALKEDSDVELITAIKQCLDGRCYISPTLADNFLPHELEKLCVGGRLTGKLLTNREKQVIVLVAEGNKSKEIADVLRISIRTVEHHRANIMRKIGAKNTAEMIRYVIQQGLMPAAE
jgi:DNA-binding NarL/FixJ family response regulator